MSVKLETQTIRTIAAFENMTKVHARDCVTVEDTLYFLVDPDKIGFAIGRNGSNIKEVSRSFGKAVRLFAFKREPGEMIRSMIPTVKSVEIKKETISLSVPSSDRVAVIGRNGKNIKALKDIMKRHFGIKNIKLR
jgi:N utilization substance protein A